jgi:hypothetical protein
MSETAAPLRVPFFKNPNLCDFPKEFLECFITFSERIAVTDWILKWKPWMPYLRSRLNIWLLYGWNAIASVWNCSFCRLDCADGIRSADVLKIKQQHRNWLTPGFVHLMPASGRSCDQPTRSSLSLVTSALV